MICCIVVVLAILFYKVFFLCFLLCHDDDINVCHYFGYGLLFVVVTFEKSKIVTLVMLVQ